MILWLDSSREKPWVAIITGLDPTYGLARAFLPPVDKRKGARAYLLEEGPLYQVQPIEGDRNFLMVQGDKEAVLTTEAAMELVRQMEAGKRKEAERVDDAIGRVNFTSEGGFSAN